MNFTYPTYSVTWIWFHCFCSGLNSLALLSVWCHLWFTLLQSVSPSYSCWLSWEHLRGSPTWLSFLPICSALIHISFTLSKMIILISKPCESLCNSYHPKPSIASSKSCSCFSHLHLKNTICFHLSPLQITLLIIYLPLILFQCCISMIVIVVCIFVLSSCTVIQSKAHECWI